MHYKEYLTFCAKLEESIMLTWNVKVTNEGDQAVNVMCEQEHEHQ